ncbi:SAC3 [Cyberlindnera jadinii]|uniref:Nuclear mRNA export factor n=1 Tax=Cyberlindnera jadinii (strain ATCC 18201 / CBS 1600 / BCRC 20928 / JCM 3617 / NBRC 0987 / NRRL Y-1542) TaxID=983966 RepID=A0A0H5C7Q3_CYBJN|nr:SAC3 [Cyberlindnera jadinii]
MIAFTPSHPEGGSGLSRKNGNFSKKNPFQNSSSKNFVRKPTSSSSALEGSTHASNSSGVTLSPEELALDPVIGGFQFDASKFQRVEHATRKLPKFLLYQSSVLTDDHSFQDQWDRENQSKMALLESKASDPSSLFEEFQQLRNAERKYMEEKGLVDKEGTRKLLDQAISFRGSCHDMCPVYERIRRSVENDVRKYERDPSTGKISKSRAIKAFSRPAAGQPPPLPSDVRPPQVLLSTLDYLIDNVLQELPEAQSFIWDRTRSIRQDFTYQNYFGPEAVECHEKIVRIHIITLHVMAKTSFEFSRQQELEQMNKALKTLSEMYSEYRSRGLQAPNEAEFRAYYMLSQHRDPELDREIQELPKEILEDDKVQMALNIRNLIQTNIVERGFQFTENVLDLFKTFFHNFKRGTFPLLMTYIMEVHLNEIRFYAFKAIKRSLHTRAKPYPVNFFIELLAFNDESDLSDFCNYYGVQISILEGKKYVDIFSLTHNSHLIPDHRPFRQSFCTWHDSKVSSYKDVVNIGQSNLGLTFGHNSRSTTVPSFGSQQSTSFVFQGGAQNDIQSVPQQTSFGNVNHNTSAYQFSFPNSEPKVQNPTQDTEALQKQQREHEITAEKQRLKQEEEIKAKARADAIAAERELARKKVEEQKLLEEKQRQLRLERQERLRQVVNTVADSLSSTIIGKVVKEEVQCIVKPLADAQVQTERRKRVLLESYSQGLYEAFISELIYFETMDVIAENFRNNKLKQKLVWKVIKIASKIKQKQELKKRRREEFVVTSKNFGIPQAFKRKRVLSGAVTSSLVTNNKPSVKPVDLSGFNFERMLTNLSRLPFEKYELLVFFEEFESTTSKFLRRKFCIGEDLKHVLHQGNVELEIIGSCEINPHIFENVSVLVFNCDGVEKIREQSLILRELVEGISLNTNFKFQILIVYWEFEGIIKFSKEDILNELGIPPNGCIESIELVKLNPSLNCEPIQSIIDSMGLKIELSAKGEYNEKYSKPKPLGLLNRDPKRPVSSGPVIHKDVSEKKVPQYLSRYLEYSPLGKKIPQLLSDKKDNLFKVPLRKPIVEPKEVAKPLTTVLDSQFHTVKTHKKKVEVYTTPKPKSSDLLQTPSFNDSSSTISNLSNITFASRSAYTPLILNKPNFEHKTTQEHSSDVIETEESVPRSILELRKLAATVKKNYGHKD